VDQCRGLKQVSVTGSKDSFVDIAMNSEPNLPPSIVIVIVIIIVGSREGAGTFFCCEKSFPALTTPQEQYFLFNNYSS
jgi:hypothetical protein